MKVFLHKNSILTYCFVLAITLLGLYISLKLTKGNFTYALDDAYIHISVAKNLVERGLWSVDGISKASASSSPFWVLILAFFYLLLGKEIFLFVPLVLNITFMLLSLFLILKFFKNHFGIDLHFIYGILISLIIPTVALILGGMEHAFHIFLLIMFLDKVFAYFKNPTDIEAKKKITYLAPFVVFVRYESFALILAFCTLAIINFKDYKLSLSTLISSLIFIVAFALLSKFYFNSELIPNSIQAKSLIIDSQGILPTLLKIFKNFFQNLLHPHIVGLYILNIVILIERSTKTESSYFLWTLLFLLGLSLHLAFGKVGWLFRYEAYLVVFGIINALIHFIQNFSITKWKYLLIVLLLPPFGELILYSPYQAIIGTKNIYEQQMQSAKFLQENCNNCSVAANDIGAITYFTNIKLLDLIGLANDEVLQLRKKRQLNNEKINVLLAKHKVEFIIIYEHWFEGMEFKNFTKIGEWKIQKNVVCGGETVSFFSRNDVLEKNIKKFKNFTNSKLPETVIFRICDVNNPQE